MTRERRPGTSTREAGGHPVEPDCTARAGTGGPLHCVKLNVHLAVVYLVICMRLHGHCCAGYGYCSSFHVATSSYCSSFHVATSGSSAGASSSPRGRPEALVGRVYGTAARLLGAAAVASERRLSQATRDYCDMRGTGRRRQRRRLPA